MKKVILLAAVAVMAVFSANAQGKWYIGTSGIGNGFFTGGAEGGSITSAGFVDPNTGAVTNPYNFMTGFAMTKDASVWGIAPEIGYNINNDWSVGLGLGVTGIKFGKDAKTAMSFGVNPYVRWFAWRNNNFAFYAQGDVQYAAFNVKDGSMDPNTFEPATLKSSSFSVAIKPGIAYTFNEHFSMTATVGALGYTQTSANSFDDSKNVSEKGVFGLNINGGLQFGLTYTF